MLQKSNSQFLSLVFIVLLLSMCHSKRHTEIERIHFSRDTNNNVIVNDSNEFVFAVSSNELTVFDCIHYKDLHHYLATSIPSQNFNFCDFGSIVKNNKKYTEANKNFGHTLINEIIERYQISKDSSHLVMKLISKIFKEVYFPNDSILILDSVSIS